MAIEIYTDENTRYDCVLDQYGPRRVRPEGTVAWGSRFKSARRTKQGRFVEHNDD